MTELTRLVYTAGTLKLTDAARQARRLIVKTDVLRRPPSARYQNERSNPSKWFFGYVSLWIGEYVQAVFPLEYEAQIVFLWDNLHLQNNHALYCISTNNNNNLAILGSAMTPPALVQIVPQEVPSFPGCPTEWIKFKLEPLTRIQVTALWEPAFACLDITVPVVVPIGADNVLPYPQDRPLSQDPARSPAESGELPGDTALSSANDPDVGFTNLRQWRIRFFYTDLASSGNNRFIESAVISAIGILALGNVQYSNPGGAPDGGFRRADIQATDESGQVFTVNLFSNSSNAGTATQLSVVEAL